jgi:hypothetical protein
MYCVTVKIYGTTFAIRIDERVDAEQVFLS